MPLARVRSCSTAVVLAFAAAASPAFAQNAADPPTARVYCIKVNPGKGAEFDAFLRDVSLPLAQVRADSGERSSLITLAAAEVWWTVEVTGPAIGKGGYMRVNHYKIKPGRWDEWVKAERAGWKPLVEEWNKAGGKGGWGVYGLMMPSGDSLPYDGATVDTFADWNSLIRGVPLGELWPKVHPGFSINETLAHLDKVRSVHDVTTSRIEAVVSPSAAK